MGQLTSIMEANLHPHRLCLRTHVIVECRGKKEDAELELEFRRICDGANPGNRILPFDIIFADKKTNLAGLQLADLVARPVGRHHIRPQQLNQAGDGVAEGQLEQETLG
ncbi:MAG TPA: DUF3800 domain-containing protein [Bordetella sp.]